VMDKLTPYPYQLEDITKIVDAGGNAIVATQVGGGKTLIAVEVAKRLGSKVNVVIAPKGTHVSAWEKTIHRQLDNVSIKYLNSSKNGQVAFNQLAQRVDGWYIISPEMFRKFHWAGIVPDFAVFDEAHRASNRKSKTALMLHTLKAKSKLAMSGTIAGNRIDGFWSILRWVFPDVAGRSYWSWVEKYCDTEVDFFAGKIVTGELNPGAIVASVPCYIRHLKRENCCEHHPNGIDSQLPPVVEEVRIVQLLPEQRRIYNRLEDELCVWLGDNPLIVDVPVAMRIRLRQITLGMPTITDDNVVTFADDCKSSKLDEFFEIVSDHPDGEQMLVLTHSQKFARLTVNRLIGKGFTAFEWSGASSQDARNRALEAFKRGEIQFIVGVISAIGEGTDGLQDACSVVVWLSKDDNRLLNEQASGRLDRNGQKRSVVSYEILADDTYDFGQFSKLVADRISMNESLRRENG
jgi:superfamily II DNA or RNA helicase